MGCGGSKLTASQSDSLPAKLKPLLLQRLGEMRRRSRNVVSYNSSLENLSKKELLKEAVGCDDDVSAHHPISDQPLKEDEEEEKKKQANEDVVNVDNHDDVVNIVNVDKNDSLPAKIRPLLLRRLGDLRRRTRNVVSCNSSHDNLSKKELLKEAVVSDDDISAHPISDQSLEEQKKKEVNDDVNVDSNDDEEDDKAEEHEANEAQPPSPKSPRVVPEPENEPPMVVPELENEPEKMLKQRSKQDLHLKIETPVLGGNRFIDDGLYPGSPSFRFYFIDSLTDKDDDDKNSDKEDDSDKKSQTDRSSSADVDSVNSDSATKKKKKSRRIHRFRNVIPKGKTASVRNLLNVRSCYKPLCGGQQDDSVLLRQKTPHSI
ncbi:hypothetical protein M5689_017524 [Euphorbia peplus]|nr:hypothetical protein M5689_017524 [Euphorbia peplus]